MQNKKKIERDNIMIKRSNALIEAKYSSTLLEKKVAILALSRMKQQGNKLVASISAKEIRDALGISGNGIYEQLKTISEATVQHFLILEDDQKNQRFDIISIIERAQYRDGTLTFTFNDEIKKHTIDVTKRFTLTSVSTLLSFKSNNTYRLYELLMIHYYKCKNDSVFEVRYDLSELRFLLGLVDTNKPEVARAVRAGKSYDEILETVIKDYKYKDWTNFKARILEQSRKEMDKSDLSEISFTYKPIRQHRGGKTTGVIFYISKKGTVRPPENIIDIVSSDDINAILEFSNGDIDNVSAETLLKAAKNDVGKVLRVYKEYKRRNGISNPIGWMMKAITEDWIFVDADQTDVPKSRTSTSENRFNNFEQREYDYEQLEKMLLERSVSASSSHTDIYEENTEKEHEEPVEEQIDGQMSFADFLSPSQDDESEKVVEEIDEDDIDNMSIDELKMLLKKQARKKKEK